MARCSSRAMYSTVPASTSRPSHGPPPPAMTAIKQRTRVDLPHFGAPATMLNPPRGRRSTASHRSGGVSLSADHGTSSYDAGSASVPSDGKRSTASRSSSITSSTILDDATRTHRLFLARQTCRRRASLALELATDRSGTASGRPPRPVGRSTPESLRGRSSSLTPPAPPPPLRHHHMARRAQRRQVVGDGDAIRRVPNSPMMALGGRGKPAGLADAARPQKRVLACCREPGSVIVTLAARPAVPASAPAVAVVSRHNLLLNGCELLGKGPRGHLPNTPSTVPSSQSDGRQT